MASDAMAEQERALQDAIDADDTESIKRLEAAIDSLDVKPSMPSLLAAALWYAQSGLKIFPLQPGTKIPLKGSHGCLDATTDTDTINDWWTRTPAANIGLATGHTLDVVDIDGPAGQRARVAHWDDIFEKVDADNVGKVFTPRGMHIYVPATGDHNAANIVDSVDYRGVNGYVVCPPSRTPDGSYRWLGTPHLTGV